MNAPKNLDDDFQIAFQFPSFWYIEIVNFDRIAHLYLNEIQYGMAAEPGQTYRVTLPQIRAGEYEGLPSKVCTFIELFR